MKGEIDAICDWYLGLDLGLIAPLCLCLTQWFTWRRTKRTGKLRRILGTHTRGSADPSPPPRRPLAREGSVQLRGRAKPEPTHKPNANKQQPSKLQIGYNSRSVQDDRVAHSGLRRLRRLLDLALELVEYARPVVLRAFRAALM